MIRLDQNDLEDPTMLAKLAKAAKTTPKKFKARFAHIVGLKG